MSETLNFSGDICLSRMLELADDLRRAIEPETRITLDGGQFSDVDLAGIQELKGIRVDDWVFGVSSVSKDGYESPVASAVPGGAFKPYVAPVEKK